jgi:hypothetical protein
MELDSMRDTRNGDGGEGVGGVVIRSVMPDETHNAAEVG